MPSHAHMKQFLQAISLSFVYLEANTFSNDDFLHYLCWEIYEA